MYAQAILPRDFNPFVPAATPEAQPRTVEATDDKREPTFRLPSKRAARITLEVVSWLAAPVGLAAFLLTQ